MSLNVEMKRTTVLDSLRTGINSICQMRILVNINSNVLLSDETINSFDLKIIHVNLDVTG